jgi:hypothetical protein
MFYQMAVSERLSYRVEARSHETLALLVVLGCCIINVA